jgi:hypothetical protein
MLDDIKELLAQGEELGCHTFVHCDSPETLPRVFEGAIIRTSVPSMSLIPEAPLDHFPTGYIGACPDTKGRAEKYVRCCRGGG